MQYYYRIMALRRKERKLLKLPINIILREYCFKVDDQQADSFIYFMRYILCESKGKMRDRHFWNRGRALALRGTIYHLCRSHLFHPVQPFLLCSVDSAPKVSHIFTAKDDLSKNVWNYRQGGCICEMESNFVLHLLSLCDDYRSTVSEFFFSWGSFQYGMSTAMTMNRNDKLQEKGFTDVTFLFRRCI